MKATKRNTPKRLRVCALRRADAPRAPRPIPNATLEAMRETEEILANPAAHPGARTTLEVLRLLHS